MPSRIIYLGAASFTSRNTRNALNENVNSRYFAFVQDDWNVNLPPYREHRNAL